MTSCYGSTEMGYVGSEDKYGSAIKSCRKNSTENDMELVLAKKSLLKHFAHWDTVRILSVGCGEGVWDIRLIEAIQETCKVNQLNYTGIEPSESSVEAFKKKICSEYSHKLKDVQFELFDGTWDDFMNNHSQSCLGNFDLVLFVQSLYYVEPSRAISYVVEKLLSQKGKLAVFTVSEEAFYVQLLRKFQDRLSISYASSIPTTQVVRDICTKLALPYDYSESEFIFNVTELFRPDSEEGKIILGFLFHNPDLISKMNSSLRQEILSFINAFSKKKNKEPCDKVNKEATTRFKHFVVSHVGMVTVASNKIITMDENGGESQ